jgi:carbonic anhydrase
MYKKYQWISYLLIIAILQSCNENSIDQIYSHDSSSDTTAKAENFMPIPGLKHGLLQSPINIISNNTEFGQHQVIMHFNDEINKVENKGHTVQLDFVPGSTITKDGNTYDFKQIHFHTPSEHHIDGVAFPMEMHIVNTIVDSVNNKAEKYLVMAMLFKVGKENQFISEFISKIPNGAHENVELNAGTVHLSHLLESNSKKNLNYCFHYKGSLTTPPYTESVNWFVSKNIFEASNEQIQKIKSIEGDNARHVQCQFGRVITEE